MWAAADAQPGGVRATHAALFNRPPNRIKLRRRDLPNISEPSKKPARPLDAPENALLVSVERLRRQAEEFQRTVEHDRRAIRTLLEELRVRQAKRRPVR